MLTTKEYFQLKKAGYSERKRKDLSIKVNGRSADFIIPNTIIGCPYFCGFCYIARNKPQGNPIEKFTNLDEIIEAVRLHCNSLPTKQPNQCDPTYWTYDISESTDMLSPQTTPTVNRLITELTQIPNCKPTFATKAGSPSRIAKLVDCPIPYKARIRASLMPQKIADIVEVGTAKMVDRLHGANLAYSKGFQLHINFSPVILYQGWESDYIDLFKLVDSVLLPEVKSQLQLEVIMLTHADRLNLLNLEWIPKAEKLLYVPAIQEYKVNERGSKVLRYKVGLKQKAITKFKELISQHLNYCNIRYIF
jgi:spore photoproduct lyase